jgi:hypothetical protein
MSRAITTVRDFAERLITHEMGEHNSSETKISAAWLVSEKLRPRLAIFMGSVGFQALLFRALMLANAEVPWLRAVHVKADGSLEGPNELGTQVSPDEILEGCVVLLAQLLGLLVAFIGEDLTLRLVREVWPKKPLDNFDFGKRSKQ